MRINRDIKLLDGTNIQVHDGLHRLYSLIEIQGYAIMDIANGNRIVIVKGSDGQLCESEQPFTDVPRKDHHVFENFTFGFNIGSKPELSEKDKLKQRHVKQEHHLKNIFKRNNRWG